MLTQKLAADQQIILHSKTTHSITDRLLWLGFWQLEAVDQSPRISFYCLFRQYGIDLTVVNAHSLQNCCESFLQTAKLISKALISLSSFLLSSSRERLRTIQNFAVITQRYRTLLVC